VRDVIARLLAQPQGFDLFQAISLLERDAAEKKGVGASLGEDESIRLKSDISLKFHASDIRKVSRNTADGPSHTLITPIMSLAGPNGPMPVVFTEMLLEQTKVRDFGAADFLDIFNQRLLGLLYRGRKKHHLSLQGSAWRRSAAVRALQALSSVSLKNSAQIRLNHVALQGASPRSVIGLVQVIKDRLGLRCVVESFVGNWVEVTDPVQPRLGGRRQSALRLGANTTLGTRVWSQDQAITLQAQTNSMVEYTSFLPGGLGYEKLTKLVREYFQRHIDVFFWPVPPSGITSSALSPTGTGAAHARLGLTAWIGSIENGANRPSYGSPCLNLRTMLVGPYAPEVQ